MANPKDVPEVEAVAADAPEEVELSINPARVCFGLSRIGYTPTSAICDIIDNSVRAEATTIHILIVKEHENFKDTRQNNVREYLVIDNGNGMDEDGMKKALELGASDQGYEPNSLSKFGLGLKSAVFSQGEELHLISSQGGTPFKKFVVSLPDIAAKNKYFARPEPLSTEDNELIASYLAEGKGTIVRIGKVRKVNHPSVKKTVEDLIIKAGVIYYYFINDGLQIFLGDQQIPGFDVLFTGEADANGNLDENEWEGKTVRWIEKSKNVPLDTEAGVNARIEVTQLPHPPIHELDGAGKQAEVREKYRIGSGNYGYYVYRNKRLISWAERFEGIIPQDQDFFAFRGRILIDNTADEAFNIDVKKSTLMLSDEAWKSLSDLSAAYKSKSKKAWLRANTLKKEREGESPNFVANEIAASFEQPESLSGEPAPTETAERERVSREKEVETEMKSKLRKAAAQRKSEVEKREVTEEEITEQDIEEELKGETDLAAIKIYRVQTVEDNALWEPYYDAEHGVCVRINKGHRFARQVYEENSANTDMQVMFDLFFLQMSEAEIHAQKTIQSRPRQEIEKLIASYRRILSEFLATLCREADNKLPPLQK
jgi:hypothetical protein